MRAITTLLVLSLTVSLQAASQYGGDGTENPIVTTGTLDWNTTSLNWLDINDGTGTYGVWVNGNDAVFNGDAPVINATVPITVGNITRDAIDAANDDARMDLTTSGSGSLTFVNTTINNSFTVARQFNLGAADSAGNTTVWGGSVNLGPYVNRFLLTGTQIIAPGTSVTAANAANDVRLSSSTQTDYSNLEVILGGADLDNRQSGTGLNATLGTLSGTGNLTRNGSQVLTIANTDVGDAATIGLLAGTVDLLMGTGTHNFDLLSLSGALSADKLSGSTLGLGGTLQLSLLAGSDPLKGGDTFDLFDGSLSGSFTGIDASGLGLAAGLELNTSALGSTGTITVIPEPSTLSMVLIVVAGVGLLRIRRRSVIS